MRGRRLDTVRRVEQELKLSLLAEVPLPSMGRERLADAYAALYDKVARQIGQSNGQHRTLAVTSTLPGEGRSSVVANIALAAAQHGWTVLVVDCDSRLPLQHALFGGESASPAPGLLELLAQAVHSPSEVLRRTAVENIRLLSVGDTTRHDALALFSSPRLERFVRNVAPRLADLVIFDAPHVLSNEPGRHILTHADGVLFVVRLEETDGMRARRALEKLEQHEVTVTGAVLLRPGRFLLSDAVSLPEKQSRARDEAPVLPVNLKKSSKDTETLNSSVPPEVSEQSIESGGLSMKVSGAQKVDENRDTDPSKGGGFGIEDLEAVLQGWRRRDAAATDVNGDAAMIPLPPVLHAEPPTAPAPAGVAFTLPTFGVPESAPQSESVPTSSFLSVSPGLAEEAPREKPTLTLVESDTTVPKPQEPESAEVLVTVPESAKPAVPLFAIPVMPVLQSEEPTPAPVPVPVAPMPVAIEVPTVVQAPQPVPVAPAWTPAPVAVEPAPMVPAPVAVAPVAQPPAFVSPAPVMAPIPAPIAVAAPVAAPTPPSAPMPSRAGLDLQIDMYQTGPGEMTMRAATTNAAAVGYPHISLELAMAMNGMRGMRAITPSTNGSSDQPRIALEAVSTDAPDAAKLRLVVGNTHEPALEVLLKSGEALSLRTGSGSEQPLVRIDSHSQPDGTTVLRATLTPIRGGQDLVLELRRDPVNDGFTDARWRNRLSLMG